MLNPTGKTGIYFSKNNKKELVLRTYFYFTVYFRVFYLIFLNTLYFFI